jgi:hypothetical protein
VFVVAWYKIGVAKASELDARQSDGQGLRTRENDGS